MKPNDNMTTRGGSLPAGRHGIFGGKISISYPPLESKKGVACLGQNRQFQWLKHPTYIYPVIPAYAATILKANGFEVFWDDGIAEELSYEEWKKRMITERPDIIAIETKTPVVKMHWKIIDDLKSTIDNQQLTIVLMGDHVTALPQESLTNSQVDYVMASGDYDFMLLNLAKHLSGDEALEGGWWWKENDKIVNSGPADISRHDLNALPIINRKLTRWEVYSRKNGNFKKFPGAYIMSARDCWWGKCTFCSWTNFFPGNKYRLMAPEKALDEIGNLIRIGAKEIMEDSGTLPVGSWLEQFCRGMIDRGYSDKVAIDCNMRISAIKDSKIWKLMKKAGFRMVLFGIESANQATLDKINKNLMVDDIEPTLKACKNAGLEPHVTVMLGYPWEKKEESERTVSLAKDLFRKGLIDTLQATIVVPYPGTAIYDYCRDNDLLITEDYSRFDQKEMVIRCSLSSEEASKKIQDIYMSCLTPWFILRRIISIRSWNDLRFLWVAAWKWLGKMNDFS